MATPVNLHTSSGVSVLYEEPGTGILLAAGKTVPANGSVGYAQWGLFIHTDGTTASEGLYVNTGSKDSSAFASAHNGLLTLDSSYLSSITDAGIVDVVVDPVIVYPRLTVGLGGGGTLVLGNVGTVVAAGTDQAGATAIANQITFVTGTGGGAEGVRLPAVSAGSIYLVYETTAATGLKIYPATGDDINGGSANAAITIEGKSLAMFVGLDSSTWAAIYTANS